MSKMGKIFPILLFIYLSLPAMAHSWETVESNCKHAINQYRCKFTKNSHKNELLYSMVYVTWVVTNIFIMFLMRHCIYYRLMLNSVFSSIK